MDEVYNAEKEIEEICKKNKIFFSSVKEIEGLKLSNLLNLVHNEIEVFLKNKERNGFYILTIKNPDSEEKYPLRIEYEGNEENKGTEEKDEEVEKTLGKFYDKIELAYEFLSVQPLHFDENKIWWIWEKDCFRWIKIDETSILNLIRKNCDENTIRANERQQILEALRQVSREKKPEKPKESWIQLKKKIIDLHTGEEIEASPKYFVSNPINWNLGKCEDTPNIDALFSSWVDEEHKDELYELLSFCIVPSYFIHRLFCIIGSGSNGKSTFQKILDKFIGEENITSSSLNLLLKERFEGSKLYKKLVCLIGETNFNLISNTDFLKKVTGEDMVRCEFKGKDGFDFRNYAKIVMATNSIPPTADKTDGFYRRWKIIDFHHKFKIEKDVFSEITDEEFENLALKCLNIAKRLWNERIFTNDGTFEERKQRYEEKSNPLMKFIKENYERNIQNETLFSEFFEEFMIYLEDRGFRTLSAIAVSKQLKNEGFDIKTISKEEKNGRFIIGLNKKINNINNINLFPIPFSHREIIRNKVNKVNKVNNQAIQTPEVEDFLSKYTKLKEKPKDEPNQTPEFEGFDIDKNE